jgi:hypothetical protein
MTPIFSNNANSTRSRSSGSTLDSDAILHFGFDLSGHPKVVLNGGVFLMDHGGAIRMDDGWDKIAYLEITSNTFIHDPDLYQALVRLCRTHKRFSSRLRFLWTVFRWVWVK